MSPIVYIFYIEIVQGVPVFFVSDEIVCTPFITTHGTNGVYCTLFVCIRIIIFVVGYLKDVQRCMYIISFHRHSVHRWLLGWYDLYIVANAVFYASPYHLHQKHQEHYVYCWVLKRCPKMYVHCTESLWKKAINGV